jgi:hypothetical protein
MDERNVARKPAEQQRRVASAEENEMATGTAKKTISKSGKQLNLGLGRKKATAEMRMAYGVRLQPEDGREQRLAEMRQKWDVEEYHDAETTFD